MVLVDPCKRVVQPPKAEIRWSKDSRTPRLIRVQSEDRTTRKERIDFCKSPSDPHRRSGACTQRHTDIRQEQAKYPGSWHLRG